MTQDPSADLAAAILGNAPAIVALREKIRHLASFDALGAPRVPATLVVGESGTGKGLVARAIHDSGPRCHGPFIDVNCAAIPENLLEAELFGYETGAFTDAKRPKPGLFEAAAGGTLFLDEIDALPLTLQAKFLKAVEEKRVRRLGAVADRALDVKIVAATQKDLAQSVHEGRFRLDLYHRLASVVLTLPALRERGDDIVLLAERFLRRYASASGLAPIELTGSAKNWLMHYSWPGNVRELDHLLERVVLLARGRPVDGALLEELCLPGAKASPSPARPDVQPGESQEEAARIRNALASTGGNVLRAARILGLSRNALRYRMRRYRIERPLLESESGRGESATPRLGRQIENQAPPAPAPRPKAAVPPPSPLIGREKELAVLKEALGSAANGSARAVIAAGDAGIGKTRLLRELRGPAESSGFLWLEGYYDKTGNHPYQAWVQILRQSLDHPETAALIQSLRPRELGKLMPQFAGDTTPTPLADPETERLRLFESLTQFFLELSRKTPLVLLLDDLQWAPALDFLHYLLRNVAGERILLLAACRSGEIKLDNDLWRAWNAIQREPICQVLRLEPFTADAVEQLINSKIDGAAAPSLSGAIAAKSGGNPFFIGEIVKLLQAQSALVKTGLGWELQISHHLAVPDSIKTLIGERISQLGKTAEELLPMAAVSGRQFTQQMLQSLSGKDEASVAQMLDRCQSAGIVVPSVSFASDGYEFSHDLIQESLYEGLGAAQKRRYHLAIGRILEAAGVGDSEALAYHFSAGADPERALAYSLKAGENAAASFSWSRAAAHFENALALTADQPKAAAAKADLHEKLANLQALLGRANLEHSQKALEIFTALNDKLRASRMHRLIGVAWTSGTAGVVDLEKALDHFERAAQIIGPEPDDGEKAFAHGYLAFGLLRARMDLSRAKSEAQRALKIASGLNDPDVQARVYTELGVVQAFAGELPEAEESAERSWQLTQSARDPWLGARAALYPIAFWPWRNERSWLERWTERGLKHRQSSRVSRYDFVTFALHALHLGLTGRPDRARQALSKAETAMAERAYFTPYWLHFPAAAYAILGDEDRAAELFSEAWHASRSGNLRCNLAEVVLYARYLIARGQTAEAEEILVDAERMASSHNSIVQRLNLLPLLAELSARRGDLQRTVELLGEAEPLQRRLRAWSGATASLHTARAVLAAARAEWRAAEELFDSALALEKQHGFLYTEGSILLKWAELYARRRGADDDEKARHLRRQALEIFKRCAAIADIERTQRLF